MGRWQAAKCDLSFLVEFSYKPVGKTPVKLNWLVPSLVVIRLLFLKIYKRNLRFCRRFEYILMLSIEKYTGGNLSYNP